MQIQTMFPSRYVRGQDLSAAILARIISVTQETMHPRPGVTETSYVLRVNRIDPANRDLLIEIPNVNCDATLGYGVILRHSLALQIGAMHGSDTDKWTGQVIVLEPTRMAVAGRDVTTITARAPRTPATPKDTKDAKDADATEAQR